MPSTPASSNDTHQTCIEHARAFMESTLESFQSAFEKLLSDGVDEAFKYVMSFNSLILFISKTSIYLGTSR